jgi:hypothetical protein
MLLVVAVVIGALVASGIGGAVAGHAMDAVCQIAGQGCESGGGATTSASELQSRLADLDGLVNGSGGAIANLAAQAQAAIDSGDLDTAQELIERLEFYRALFESGPRGQTLAALVTPSAAEFADLVDQGTIQADDNDTNRRYFQVPPAPGQGILVMDLFIPGENAGPLKGDGRDFENPLRNPDLEETDSRVMIIIDRETGRGVIVQTQSCTVSVFGAGFCNEPRPISINGDLGLIENDPDNDVTGEGINLDVTNNYNINADGDGVHLDYESRNSISPIPAISGDVTFQPDGDGDLSITHDDRDNFPAYSTYQYEPGEPDHVIEHNEAGSPIELITPPDLPDLPNLPDLPGPLPDLPDLPNLPQLPHPPNPPNLPDLPDLPDVPDLPGPLPNLPNLPNLPDLPG